MYAILSLLNDESSVDDELFVIISIIILAVAQGLISIN